MKRGDLYLVRHLGGRDPNKQRVMTVVSRQAVVDSRFPTVVCAPVFSRGHGLETEVVVGPEDGLKHPSWIGYDGLVSIPKSRLTDFVGSLSPAKLGRLSQALRIALEIFWRYKGGAEAAECHHAEREQGNGPLRKSERSADDLKQSFDSLFQLFRAQAAQLLP